MNNKLSKLAARLFVVVSLATVLNGCVMYFYKSKDVDELAEDSSFLAFGYVDDEEAPFNVRWGTIRQWRPAAEDPFHKFRTNKKGLFYIENLPHGSYEFTHLGGPAKNFLLDEKWSWSMPDATKEEGFERIKFKNAKQRLYYLGTYKIKLAKKGGLFSLDKYITMPDSSRGEREALQELLEHTEGTKWYPIVKKRLAELG